MGETIEIPTTGEILRHEFMEPLGLSAYALAKAMGVPVSRVQDVLHGRRAVTPDTSLRLARVFGVSDRYFLSIDDDVRTRRVKREIAGELDAIAPVVA